MDRLTEIEQRVKAATPGPWSCFDLVATSQFLVLDRQGKTLAATDLNFNATFIAHSREDVEWLVERVRELERAVRDAACCPFSGCAACVVRLRAALADHLVKGESDG